jgi:hypothetical protein
MPLTDAQTSLVARRALAELFNHLKSMDVSLTRLIELNQAPRENLFAAGSLPFGGTVGLTPQTCSMAPPIGYGPGIILASNPHRRGLSISCIGTTDYLGIGLGVQNPSVSQGLVIAPGGTWDGRISGMVWTGFVSIVGSAVGTVFSGVEISGRNETRRRGGLNQPI